MIRGELCGRKELDPTAVTVITIVCTWDAVPWFVCGTGLPDDDATMLAEVQWYLNRTTTNQNHPMSPDLLRAWERFYRRYEPLVRQIVAASYHRTACAADHEDFVQEVWTEIVAKLPRLTYSPDRGRLSSWLAVLTRRKVRRLAHRLACSWARHPHAIDNPEILLPSPDLGPEDQCVVREIRGQMDAALARLASERRRRITNCSTGDFVGATAPVRSRPRWI